IERFREPVGSIAPDPAQTRQRHEGFPVEPGADRLAAIVGDQGFDLASRAGSRHRREYVRAAQIAVVFRNLVFEDPVLPEQLAGKRADQAMVLMRVAAPMSEDQRRIEPAPHPGETILYRRALEGEIRIAKIEGLDIVLAGIGE